MNYYKVHSIFTAPTIKRILASGAIGNVLETYDLILISLMATTLGKYFFPPSSSAYNHIIDILYIYLAGFLVRPIGNIIMGSYADQIGRKKLMVISLLFTGLGTTLIGLIPSYEYIGIWSTILFVILRILQNFFAGIEYINSATYLIESSDVKTKGFFGSWTAIGISGGYLLASIIALIVNYLITIKLLPEWGWRFVFIFSLVNMIFAFWLRSSIPESFAFILNNSGANTTKKLEIIKNSFKFIRTNWKQCLSISALTFLGAYLTYIYYVYIPINLITSRSFTKNQVFSINIFSLSLIVFLIPIFGKISDFINKLKLIIMVCVVIFILSIPFFLITSYGGYFQILTISLIISIPSACFFSLYPVIITETFPSQIRCTTASLIYQLVVSIEMATLPLIVNYLILKTKLPYVPGYFMMISSIIGLFGMVTLKDSTKIRFEEYSYSANHRTGQIV